MYDKNDASLQTALVEQTEKKLLQSNVNVFE